MTFDQCLEKLSMVELDEIANPYRQYDEETKSSHAEWIEADVNISDIKSLLETGFQVEVDSPDGYVPVNFFIDKGNYEEFVFSGDDGVSIRCNEKHLFQTLGGRWVSAGDMFNSQLAYSLIGRHGTVNGRVTKTGNQIPIVDINVDHQNHRYYTENVSSHNTGVGKTLFMTHCAAANLMDGKNVLYITMEMAEEKISERIDANLLNTTVDSLSDMPKDVYEKRIARVKAKTTGKLIVKEFPTASAGSAHFRHLLNELKLKKNFKPDIVYIDYLNICTSARMKAGGNVNSYTLIKAIAEELRGLAVEFNVPVLSATQTTRTGYSSSDLNLEDTSESFGLPATADFMFGLISTEELEGLGQLMVKQLKNRWGDTNTLKRFVIGIDRAKMKLYDAEDSAQSLVDDAKPVMDRTSFAERMNAEKPVSDNVLSYRYKQNKKPDFGGLK
jgi:hypothetical protein